VVVWRHAAKERRAVLAGGIKRAQSESHSMTMRERGQKCLRILSENGQFRVSYVSAMLKLIRRSAVESLAENKHDGSTSTLPAVLFVQPLMNN
jgi:hypothetical protein